MNPTPSALHAAPSRAADAPGLAPLRAGGNQRTAEWLDRQHREAIAGQAVALATVRQLSEIERITRAALDVLRQDGAA